MLHYAAELKNESVLSILKKESVDNETEARDVLTFLDSMCAKIATDAKENVIVLHQPIHTTDAEKICDVIEDYLEELGYEDLIE